MIAVLFRIAFAVFFAVFLSKVIVQIVRLSGLSSGEGGARKSAKGKDDCIDICPECGRLKEPHHRCP